MAWIVRRLAGLSRHLGNMGFQAWEVELLMLAASGKLEYKPNKYIYIYNYKYVNAMLDLVDLVA